MWLVPCTTQSTNSLFYNRLCPRSLVFAMPGLFLSPNQKLLDSALHSHEATSFFERQPRSYSIIRESMALYRLFSKVDSLPSSFIIRYALGH